MSIVSDIRTKLGGLAATSCALTLLALGPAMASAAGPEWVIHSQANTSAAPGEMLRLSVNARNAGDAPTSDAVPTIITGTLPEGMTVTDPSDPAIQDATAFNGQVVNSSEGGVTVTCTAPDGSPLVGGESGIKCELEQEVAPSKNFSSNGLLLNLAVDVAPDASGMRTASFEVSGGGAPAASTVDPTLITSEAPRFGIAAFDALAADKTGAIFTQAGGHPYSYTTYIDYNTSTSAIPALGERAPVEPNRSTLVELPPGMVGSPRSVEQCTAGELGNAPQATEVKPLCPVDSQVGTIELRLNPQASSNTPVGVLRLALYNMEPPVGVPARFGFNILGTVVLLDARVRSGGDYGLTVGPTNAPQALMVNGATPVFWGVPGDPSHDDERSCPGQQNATAGGPNCQAASAPKPFLRLPTHCHGPEEMTAHLDSWAHPAALNREGLPDLSDPHWASTSFFTHESPGYPASPQDPSTPWGPKRGLRNCADVPVKGSLTAQPTTIDAESSSGLAVHVEVPSAGLENPVGIGSSDLKKVRVTLPQGITINPSQSEGLGTCSPAAYASADLTLTGVAGGCPSDSKIGTVQVVTPLLEETIPGDVYVAEQGNNPFESLLALYVVLAEPERGILVKMPALVETDGTSGRIVTTFDDLPELPFSTFDFKFREGARAPLITPPTCGTYTTKTEIWGHSDPNGPPLVSESEFQVSRGVGGSPCPNGAPGFNPGFSAGSVNSNAGSFSPFLMRLTRKDGDQDMTKFSSILPPGVSAKIAGVEKCSEVAIAAAKGKTGRAELASPSCPASSQIGRSLAGAGVGAVLTYVPGGIYLAGPWNGAPLSVVAITPAVAGPFDVGAVVVRQALTLDPVTAEVRVDGEKSDPIPHILQGIPLKLRDLRVYVDRDRFTITPTSCDPARARATLFGSGLEVFSSADDTPVALSDRYQAANCSRLGFKPKLDIHLRGGARRGAFPGLKAILTPRAGDANLARASVVLPKFAFLEQGHIRTICTRVQYTAGAGHGAECPPGSVYGFVRAFSPLLDEPLQGPVFLRSSDHKLPDMVLTLRGIVDIEAVGRIDSVSLGGGGFGIRSTFPEIPDAPISRVVLTMQGGRKGLIVNSRNICLAKDRAKIQLDGQNGKASDSRPLVRVRCGGGSKRKRAGS